jgi:tetratricopeptide (TPR) repeat protein
MGFADTALKDFREAIQLNDQSVEAFRLEAEAFVKLGNHYRATLSATEALHVDPTNALAYAVRGAAYVELEKWDQGIADLTEAGRRDPSLKQQLAPVLAKAYREREAEREIREPPASSTTAANADRAS